MKRHKTNDISALKKILFTLIAVSLPLLLILLLELTLRLFNYGGTLDLFVLHTQGHRSEYVLNKDFTKRYFFHKGIKTPIPLSQTFSADKNDSTVRVFCLGASTTQGFPYQPNGSYPAILQNMLADVAPDKHIEVINCGITAITSHSVLDMEREILRNYQPDVLVIYTGHNEFYGVFGQASTLSLFKNRFLLKSFLSLQRSRLVLLTRNTINGIFGRRLERQGDKSTTLMRLMARDIGIELSSRLMQKAQNDYRKNLRDMIRLAQKHNTKILLCTLADNQRDLPPFASKHAASFADRDSLQWQTFMRNGQQFFEPSQCDAALDQFQQALHIDSTYALTHYRLAHCFAALQDSQNAKKHFQLAKDFDTIRFRAPSSFNSIIRRLAQDYDVPVVDVEESFRAQSPGGVAGFNLLFEHVHPNLNGYELIARSIAQVMKKNQTIDADWDWSRAKSDSAYMAQTAMTLVDHEVVNYTLYRLTNQWPFPAPESMPPYKRIGSEKTEELARRVVDAGQGIVEAHLDYGHELHQNNQLDAALLEYKAALAIQPLAVTYNRLGRVYLRKTEEAFRQQHDYAAALSFFQHGVHYFREGLERWPDDVELNFNLGLLYFMRQDQIDAAIAQFLNVLELEPDHKNAHRQLVELYMRQQNFDKAKTLLEKAVTLFPNEARFCTDLGVICLHEKNYDKARTWLTKAIQLNNDPKAQFFLNQLEAQSPRH